MMAARHRSWDADLKRRARRDTLWIVVLSVLFIASGTLAFAFLAIGLP